MRTLGCRPKELVGGELPGFLIDSCIAHLVLKKPGNWKFLREQTKEKAPPPSANKIQYFPGATVVAILYVLTLFLEIERK